MAEQASSANTRAHANYVIGYLESIGGINPSVNASAPDDGANRASKDQSSVYHKVQGDSVAKRSSGAWGSRGATLQRIDTQGME